MQLMQHRPQVSAAQLRHWGHSCDGVHVTQVFRGRGCKQELQLGKGCSASKAGCVAAEGQDDQGRRDMERQT